MENTLLYLPIKAAFTKCMARRANLAHLDQKRIAIAIVMHGFYVLKMSRSHALDPIFFSGARPKAGLADLQGLAQRIDVHVRHHQHFFGSAILHNGRDQAVGAEFQFVQISRRDLYRFAGFSLLTTGPRLSFL